MKKQYNESTLTHNISGVILPSERYQYIFKKGAYLIPPVIALYNDTIYKNETRIEVHRAEGKHEAQINHRQLYRTSDNDCRRFIMAVVEKLGTRSSRTLIPYTPRSRPSNSWTTSQNFVRGFTPWKRWIFCKL